MPPKKTEKSKIVEDKTFGLKNKNKSAKVSRYVENVKNQAKQAGQSRKELVMTLVRVKTLLHHHRPPYTPS